jgi:hypothetical protein
LWQEAQLALTLKAALPSWHAPHDLPFSIAFMETFDLPRGSAKSLVWQLLHW